jgi:glycosyltransferase involved in cell wall biosynthesis
MRICHVSPHLPPDQAANALLPAELGRRMAARGDDVAFVAHEPGQIGPGGRPDLDWPLAESRLSPLPVRWIPRRRPASVLRSLKIDAWLVVRRVKAALSGVAGHADLLHLHSNGLIIEAAAAWARQHRIPYVLTLYGTEIWHYKRPRRADRFTNAYGGAAQVTFYSERLMQRAKRDGLDRDGLSVVYPAVTEAFAPCDEATREAWRRELDIAERFVILNVKRLHELAGQRFLLSAFASLCESRRDVRLLICGEGPRRDDLLAQARTLGVADRVTMTGLVPNHTVARYMATADVFALPSLLEALPTVAVEALACGTPVISADHPGGVELRDIFGDDITIVPRETVEPLARALTDFFDRPRRARPETASQITARFRPSSLLQAFDHVYENARRGTTQ